MQACLRGERKFPPKRTWSTQCFRSAAVLGLLLGFTGGTFAAPPGAPIDNAATMSFENAAGAQVLVTSNVVELVTGVSRTPSTITLTRVVLDGDFDEPAGPAFCAAGGGYSQLPDPVIPGIGPIDPGATQSLATTSSYNAGEPVFLRLDDRDQNVDYLVVDTATVVVTNPANGDAVRSRSGVP